MLSDENYKNKWEEKKKWYEDNGIYEASDDNKDEVQLIITKDENGALHIVWFEDARSIKAKLDLVTKYNLGGVSFWTIMNYFPQGYAVLNNNFQVEKL